MFQAKILSSLEKCFLDDDFSNKPELAIASMLCNEQYSFCVAITMNGDYWKDTVYWNIETDLPANIKVYKVGHVPVEMAVFIHSYDDNYLKTTPGLYPDLLTPTMSGDPIHLCPGYVQSLWLIIEPNENTIAGEYTIGIKFSNKEGVLGIKNLPVTILAHNLPAGRMTVTQWFYCDCLAQYYNVEVFGDAHFNIIENFIKTAVENGINTILTPVFTPPLDTAVGDERLTTQLVGVNKENDDYTFDFALLDRWIDICERQNVQVYEIAHLFTQWGAAYAPKIMAYENGAYKQVFGWDTDACGEGYKGFLGQFIPALLKHLNSRGIFSDRVIFHISDEPSADQLESYRKAKEIAAPLLAGYKIYDALSDYEFYEQGIVENPIPANNHIAPFINNKVPNLWTYYCVGQSVDVSNRFMSMPSARNRIIGVQFYKYLIEGFLHWGYNFYNNQYSTMAIDPYRVTDGMYFGPAGDAFSVYPAADGTAYPSIRLKVFYEALQDVRAFELCESLYSRDFVLKLIDAEGPVTFDKYPKDAAYLINLRQKVNDAINNAKI